MGGFIGVFILLLATGVPIALALGVGGMVYLYLSGNGLLLLAFPQRMMAGVDNFVLLTIPLFLLAGALMNVGGITDRIVTFARAMVGHRRSGLPSVTVISAMLFAGISGSAVAEASALGSILIPTMVRQGLPGAYAAAVVGVSSILGPIIPPSITMIVYGVLAGASIGQLFIAGVMPGLLITAGLLAYGAYRARRDGFPISPRMNWSERRSSTVKTLPALLLPLIIIVGIKGGIFTATEAAAVAVIYALLVSALYRELTFNRFYTALVATAVTSASVLFITAMASIVAFVFTLEQVPTRIAGAVLLISDNPLFILLILNVVLLVLGMFLEPISILILTMPILLQFQKLIAMDPVQFGIMVVLNVVIGMATPPVGICLFIVCAASGESLTAVSRAAWPLIGICVLVLMLVALIPQISLFLPYAMTPVR